MPTPQNQLADKHKELDKIPKHLLEKIVHLYSVDFEMFGYDKPNF